MVDFSFDTKDVFVSHSLFCKSLHFFRSVTDDFSGLRKLLFLVVL